MRRSTLAAVAIAAGLVAASTLWAKDGTKENKLETESTLEAGLTFAFADVGEGSDLDWGPASGGPELEFGLSSAARFRPAFLPWLLTGPVFEARGEVEAAVISVSGEVYLAAEDAELRALAGWGGETSFETGSGRMVAGATLLGGLGAYDLSDADSDYLPSGANAESFWFRIEPCLGGDAYLDYESGDLELRARERYLATWQAESVSGIDWDQGFEERLELRAIYSPRLSGVGPSLKARAGGELSLASRLIVPVLKYSISLRGDIGWKGLGSLKLSPAIWTYKAEVPDLAKLGTRVDVKRQLSGKIEWESEIDDGSWSLSLRFPWAASVDGEVSSGEWELGASIKLDL